MITKFEGDNPAPTKKTTAFVFWLFLCVSIIFALLTLLGSVRSYSPVPFWDMWDGFLQNHEQGTTVQNLFSLHNEHRIFLARILFIIDMYIFGGQSKFLIFSNLLFVALIGMIFGLIFIRSNLTIDFKLPLILIFTFSWVQRENIDWAFQSQFILSVLVPLLAFYHAWQTQEGLGLSRRWSFLLSATFGVIAAGTMANGIFVLPLIIIYAALSRWSLSEKAILLILAVAVWIFYLHGYKTPGHHGSIINSVLSHPDKVAHYITLYLGSPLYHALAGDFVGPRLARILASALGGILILIFSIKSFVILILRRGANERAALDLFLMIFLLYILLSAAVTAGGRVIFGVEQALASRYTTPSLAAWSAMLLLCAPNLLRLDHALRGRIWIAAAGLVLILLPKQLDARDPKASMQFDRFAAALALELSVGDPSQTRAIFPSHNVLQNIANPYVIREQSVFANPLLQGMRREIGIPLVPAPISHICQGSVDAVVTTLEDPRFARIEGWLSSRSKSSHPSRISILDDRGVIIGQGVSGQPRGDVEKAIGRHARYSGFIAYVQMPLPTNMTLVERFSGCRLNVSNPR